MLELLLLLLTVMVQASWSRVWLGCGSWTFNSIRARVERTLAPVGKHKIIRDC
ncbi:hypothetical protein ACFWNL_23600 [Kitasatospora sp. NPDC058397]|uniref:hypothetical protein n=1 Tax=unclassified Kitasatospora TaxID=2633591 RepID=UPI00365A5EA4